MVNNVQTHKYAKQFCGYISIVGRPNVGKSTLLNRLIGQKLSITSRKPQTTRHQILGIKSIGDYQFLYNDTPGLLKNSKTAMNKYLNQTAKNSVVGMDVLVLVLERLKFLTEDEYILNSIKKQNVPIIIVINKIDQINEKEKILQFIKKNLNNKTFNEICFVSALKGDGVDLLENTIKKFLPESCHLYKEDALTNRSLKFITAERIREKLMRRLGDELPYSLTVEINDFEEKPKINNIAVTIWVNKLQQKAIVIGKHGKLLKEIGSSSRLELEKIMDKKVYLKLWVKVRTGWAESLTSWRSLNYDK